MAMRLFGQGSPTANRRACARWAAVFAAISAIMLAVPCALAAEIDVRIRFAWGSGGQSPQKWHGKITAAGATLEALQPLGIEADEAAALRLDNNEIRVAPLIRRAFDGCDVTIRGDEAAIVKVDLQHSPAAPAKVIEVPLGEVAKGEFRAPLDDLGGNLIVHRAPGDKLRAHIDRDHLVFNPGEPVALLLHPGLAAEAADSPLTIKATLHSTGSGDAIQEIAKSYAAASDAPIALEFTAPPQEGAYRVTIAAIRPAGIANRLNPWDKKGTVASREVEFVVIDPAARLPRLTNSWEVVATIHPSNTSWWQRMPQWTQFEKLPAFSTPRPLGNVRPAVVAASPLGLVELPAQVSAADATSSEPAWQAYLLPVRRIGEPHAVEVELPRGARQHLGVSIVEPDAAGRVLAFGRDSGVYCDEQAATLTASSSEYEVHRLVFWPRTKSPAILLTNRSTARPAQFGKIRLLHRNTSPPPADEEAASAEPQRLVAAYIAAPRFAESLGAAEEFDGPSGLSVDGWNTFLTAANRLAQHLRAAGYNAAVVAIAADGSSLAPIDSLGASPRFDTGPLSAAGADLRRKDVLEVLLRVFDREGLKLIPAVQLAAPLPGLELLAAGAAAEGTSADLRWINRDGRPWSEHYPAESAAAPHYNILRPEVQTELTAIADQLLARYGNHPSLAGLSIQLTGNGYGVLPGLVWGMDDATTTQFASDLSLELPNEGPARFQQRAALLLGQHLAAWSQWRQNQLTQFYANLAARVARDRPDLQLVLCTEDIFTGPVAAERLRQAVGGRAPLSAALGEIGLNLEQLAAAPGVTLLRPRRLAAEESVDGHALDQRLNSAVELDQTLASHPRSGELLFHPAARLRLPSFDAQSPFGSDKTYLALHSPSFPVGDASRQALVAALASRDFITLADGAESLPLADNDAYIAALRTFQELPPATTDVRTERHQPVTLRVYRDQSSTTLCLINESRWPVNVDIPLESDADLVWRQLGDDPSTAASDGASAENAVTRGSLPRGNQKLSITLPPFGLQARRYSSRSMRVGAFTPNIAEKARQDLARRVDEIQERMASLNVERPYEQLQNPQFELIDEAGRFRGWQPRLGQRGAVAVANDESLTPTGRSVHLRSEDDVGVAVQSHLFAIPATGQIVVRAKIRAAEMQPGAQLYAWIEYESGGAMRQRYAAIGDHSLAADWSECEFAVDDLPLATTGKMRVQFHLAGHGQAWVDDVRLFDLRFADAHVVELSKRLLGARAALEDGQLMDCQRLVDGYLPRRVIEHVPPPALAAKPQEAATTPTAEQPEQKGLGPRIRGMVPRILR